jgi:hypothetical protein
MLWYDIVSGILFIFSIIDFTLAAPVLLQEKRQACADVGHIPKDVITVMGKRVDQGAQELERLLDKYFKATGNPAESSNAPAWVGNQEGQHVQQPNPRPSIPTFESSGKYSLLNFAQPGLEHGPTSTNVVQAHEGSRPLEPPIHESPEMYPPSRFVLFGYEHGSTSTNVVQAHEGSRPLGPPILESAEVPSSSFASSGLEHGSTSTNVVQAHEDSMPFEPPIFESSEMHPSSSVAPSGLERGSTSTNVVQAPALKPASSTANPAPLFEPSVPLGAVPMQGS